MLNVHSILYLRLDILSMMYFTENEWWFLFEALCSFQDRLSCMLWNITSFLPYKIIFKKHRSLIQELSCAWQLSHVRFAVLATFPPSFLGTKSITINEEDRNFLSYKYIKHIAIWRPLKRVFPAVLSQKYCLACSSPLLTDVAVGIRSPIMSHCSFCCVSFSVTPICGAMNNMLLKNVSSRLDCMTSLPQNLDWQAGAFPLLIASLPVWLPRMCIYIYTCSSVSKYFLVQVFVIQKLTILYRE